MFSQQHADRSLPGRAPNPQGIHEVISIQDLSKSTYILRIERKDLDFEPGQHILLGEAGKVQKREYSIYSGKHDPFLDILIREIPDGLVSRKLRKLRPGSKLELEPPVGFFTLPSQRLPQDRFLFIASGTGISPFHSFICSNDDLDYTLVHGIRYTEEKYGAADYDADRYVICATQDKKGHFHGRLTAWLLHHRVDEYAMVYLCGNYSMILDAMDMLRSKGIREHQMNAEVYF